MFTDADDTRKLQGMQYHHWLVFVSSTNGHQEISRFPLDKFKRNSCTIADLTNLPGVGRMTRTEQPSSSNIRVWFGLRRGLRWTVNTSSHMRKVLRTRGPLDIEQHRRPGEDNESSMAFSLQYVGDAWSETGELSSLWQGLCSNQTHKAV